MFSFRLPELAVSAFVESRYLNVTRETLEDGTIRVLTSKGVRKPVNLPRYDAYNLDELLAAGVNVTPVNPTVITPGLDDPSVLKAAEDVISENDSKE